MSDVDGIDNENDPDKAATALLESRTGTQTASTAGKGQRSRRTPVAPPPKEYDGGKDATNKPPSLDEWQDFIGRIVIRTLTDGYVTLMLRDYMEEMTPRELELINLSKEECHDIAAPFATLSTKSKFMRKHGRTIVAAADSYEAVIVLAMWMRRVNRISKKYRRAQAPAHSEVPTSQQPGAVPILRRVENSEPVRSDESQGTRTDIGPPNGGGIRVVNPGTG